MGGTVSIHITSATTLAAMTHPYMFSARFTTRLPTFTTVKKGSTITPESAINPR